MAMLFSGTSETPRDWFEAPDKIVCSDNRTFEIGERIKAGGNGVVHRCIDVLNGDAYAVKFQLDLRATRLQRFARERQLLSELSHDHLMIYEGHGEIRADHVVKSRDRTRRAGAVLPFIVMQLAESNLSDSVRRDEIAKEIYFGQFRGLAHALGTLHSKAIHRDIKPENVLVVGDRWVISDYGLCDLNDADPGEDLTPDWQIVGPRFWMSPEANNRSVGRTDEIDSASDVFQLASVFWFVVNRSHPTGILTRSDWQGPDALFDPIFRALHYDRSVRPADGNAFAQLIDAAIES